MDRKEPPCITCHRCWWWRRLFLYSQFIRRSLAPGKSKFSACQSAFLLASAAQANWFACANVFICILQPLLPAVTPLCLNPKYVACTCSSACLCLPDGWYMQRAYNAHRPLLSWWMHYVNLQWESVMGCCCSVSNKEGSKENSGD